MSELSTTCGEGHAPGIDHPEPLAPRPRQLDRFCDGMRNGMVVESMDRLVAHLYALRAGMSPEAWNDHVATVLLRHPIRELLHRDPYTFRAFSKRCGNTDDAILTDMVYFEAADTGVADGVGHAVFRYLLDSTAARAMRNRRRRIAVRIDETVRARPDARVLALGAGHLREIELARTLGDTFVGEIVAVDEDESNLAVIHHEYATRGVRTLHMSIDGLIAERSGLGGFDLIYAADLFERLPPPPARALAERMFAMLNPGGRMLVANFVPDIADVGYQESYMDWRPICRGERDMLALVAGIAREDIADAELSLDAIRNIAYLELQRRSTVETALRRERLRVSRALLLDKPLKNKTEEMRTVALCTSPKRRCRLG